MFVLTCIHLHRALLYVFKILYLPVYVENVDEWGISQGKVSCGMRLSAPLNVISRSITARGYVHSSLF